jgi:hypothetical protein
MQDWPEHRPCGDLVTSPRPARVDGVWEADERRDRRLSWVRFLIPMRRARPTQRSFSRSQPYAVLTTSPSTRHCSSKLSNTEHVCSAGITAQTLVHDGAVTNKGRLGGMNRSPDRSAGRGSLSRREHPMTLRGQRAQHGAPVSGEPHMVSRRGPQERVAHEATERRR